MGAFAIAMAVVLASHPWGSQKPSSIWPGPSRSGDLGLGRVAAYRTALSFTDSPRISVQQVAGGRFDVYTTNAFGFAEHTDPTSTVFN